MLANWCASRVINFSGGSGMKFYKFSCVVVALLLANVCLADEPTAGELCRKRNAASCEINGLQFFMTEQECPRGAKVLRPRGKERCDNLAETAKNAENVQVQSAVSPASPAAASAMPQQEEGGGLFKVPFLVVAVIGLMQGLISRPGWGQFVIVGGVMPLLVTWGMVSGVQVQADGMGYFGYLGMEFLRTFLFALAGWGAGLALRSGLLKLL
jgi:hypothetical protein